MESVIVHGFGLAWYPINQTPLDKATYTISMTVPEPMTATATGELTATINNGDTSTYVWEVSIPVSGVSFAAPDPVLDSIVGPDGLTINNYFPSDFTQISIDRFDIVPDVIALFTGLFGPFPFDSFGITFLRGNLPFRGFGPPQRVFLMLSDERLIAHEISHQWFGGSVSPASPADNWLAEGFVTYAEILWAGNIGGVDSVAESIRSIRRRIGENTRPPAVVNSPAEVIDQSAYLRGVLTLHALRLELGDDDFFEILRTYTARFKYGTASTADSMSISEEISQQNLGEFFNAWVYSEPVPQLDQ